MKRGYTEVEMVEDFLLLLASGGEHLDDFEVLGEDAGLFRLLSRDAPSPDAARTFLLRFHVEALIENAQKAADGAGERSFVPEENTEQRGLGEVSAELVRRFADSELGTSATLDHDATVIDSHKQEAKARYKGGREYKPVAVLWAKQDLVGVFDQQFAGPRGADPRAQGATQKRSPLAKAQDPPGRITECCSHSRDQHCSI